MDKGTFMKEVKILTPMSSDERLVALALGGCSYMPGSSQKRFGNSICSIAETTQQITEKQRVYLYLLAIRMRRQIDPNVLALIPEEKYKQYEEQKENRKRKRL
jgi:hypothetical protein